MNNFLFKLGRIKPIFLLVIGFFFYCSAIATANSPSTRSGEYRRALPILFPEIREKFGVLYQAEYHHGLQEITLDDGSALSKSSSLSAFTLFGMMRATDRLTLGLLAQASSVDPWMVVIPVLGGQATYRVLQDGNHSLILGGIYQGALLIMAPSGGVQAFYRFRDPDAETYLWSISLGVDAAIQRHYYHRVKDEGVSFPAARYTGNLVSSGPFIGSSVQAGRFLTSAKIGYAFRHALADDDASSYKAESGFYLGLNLGLSLESIP